MSYAYNDLRPTLFTDDGQRTLLRVRDNARAILDRSCAFRAEAPALTDGDRCIDPWLLAACLDRMVELGELREVPTHKDAFLQHRIFVSARRG
jgi:hypothetical protein